MNGKLLVKMFLFPIKRLQRSNVSRSYTLDYKQCTSKRNKKINARVASLLGLRLK